MYNNYPNYPEQQYQHPYYNPTYNPWMYQYQQPQFNQQQNQQNVQTQNVQQQNNLPVQNEIQGRYVNDISEILAKEVTMDGRTIFFPTKDEKLIYAKRWNNNGTIETGVYKLVSEEHPTVENSGNHLINMINERFDRMEKMLTPSTTKKKGVANDEQPDGK